MRIKNRFYNNYLKALRETQGNVTPRNAESKQIQELEFINNHIQRFYHGDYFSHAIIEVLNGFKYKITADAKIYKIENGTLKPIKPHSMANLSTLYRALRYNSSEDSSQHNVHLHLVMMVCAYPEFFETYMSNTDLKVNHTIIAGDLHEREDFYDAYYNLELTTHALNLRHGWFVKRYGLWGVHLEAEDIGELEPNLIKLDDTMSNELKYKVIRMNVGTVKDYYLKKGLAV